MSVVALSSTVFSAADGDTYVSSAQTYPTRVFLNADYDQNDIVRFESTAGGSIEVLSSTGRRVGIVPGYGSAVAVQKGDNDTDGWVMNALVTNPAAHLIDATDLATALTRISAMLVTMRAHGLLKAE
jgi:hypothetical protein